MDDNKLIQSAPKLPDYGIFLENHHHGKHFRMDSHAHETPSLLYVTSGRGRCRLGENEYPLEANTALVLSRHRYHQLIDKARQAMAVFVIYFTREGVGSVSDAVVDDLTAYGKPIYVPPARQHRLRVTLRQMLYEQDTQPIEYPSALQQGLGGLLLELYRTCHEHADRPAVDDNSESRVAEVLHYVSQHYYQRQSLVDAAKMAQLSQRRFSTLCRKLTGESFVQFVNRHRVERARELLSDSSMSVSGAVFEVGFEEFSTFYRAFRRRFGCSPTQLLDDMRDKTAKP